MENLYELLEEAAHKVPTKGILIVNNSQCDLFLTYSELREKSRKIAFILKSYYQVKPVSKIIISVEKSENFILLFWGCVMAGCIPVLMPSVQFSNKNSIAFERLKNAIDILGVVTLITNDINLFEYYKSSFHKAVCVEDIMKQLDLLQDYSLHIPKRDSKDLCVIQFSSGSTGAPKGVMLSFNNILTNLKIKTLADEITTEDTLIHWMPYFHDYGLFGNHLVCLYNQITEIKIEPFSFLRDPLIFLKKISEYQVSICGGTTPSGLDLLIQKLEQSNDIKELDLSQVKTLSIGAEMVPSNLYVRLSPLFQLGFNRNAFRPSYGMAETTLIVSSCLPGYGNKNIRINREAFYEGIIKLVDKQQDFCEFVSAGRILPGLQVRIVKDGIPQNNLNLGEIQVKGACVMSGYYNDIQSTDEVLKDGWLSTGDLGFFDYNNILYIVGRKKETIIVNGQNFHPLEINEFANIDLVLSLYTLQFLPLWKRKKVLQRIYNGLVEGGAFIFVEKIRAENSLFEDIWNDLYWDFKQENGLNEQQVIKKAQSLRGVLIPLSLTENLSLLSDVGFQCMDTFIKWHNFAGIIAVKMPSKNDIEENTYLNTDKNNKIQQ